MPKAGTYDYPIRNLDDCIEHLRKARDTVKDRVMTRETFAQAIGQSVKGGGFGVLVGALADYGLVDTGGGQIKTTALGEKILYGEADERMKAKQTAVRNVLLFADIYDKFGENPSEEQLRIFLRDKAKVEISEANMLAAEIGKLLKTNLPYLKPAPSGGGGEKPKVPTDMIGRLETNEYGIMNIKDELSLNLAIKLLTEIRKVRQWKETTEQEQNAEAQNAVQSGTQS